MALEAQIADGGACLACTCGSDADAAVCRSPCLTACEIATAASVSGLPIANIRNGQSWYCRAVDKGWLQPEFNDSPFTLWFFACAPPAGPNARALRRQHRAVLSGSRASLACTPQALQGLWWPGPSRHE